ncbi:MAG: hypothetical protein WA421_11960, partial [Nitrososphaeraceae archaeon]
MGNAKRRGRRKRTNIITVNTEFGYNIIKSRINKWNIRDWSILGMEIYNILTYCVQNPNASHLETKKKPGEDMGRGISA